MSKMTGVWSFARVKIFFIFGRGGASHVQNVWACDEFCTPPLTDLIGEP